MFAEFTSDLVFGLFHVSNGKCIVVDSASSNYSHSDALQQAYARLYKSKNCIEVMDYPLGAFLSDEGLFAPKLLKPQFWAENLSSDTEITIAEDIVLRILTPLLEKATKEMLQILEASFIKTYNPKFKTRRQKCHNS